ncbi:MAG: proline racemase family protein [Planctomycetota bacterium]
MTPATSLHVIDSHTEGEPTRVVVDGLPDLDGHTVAEKRALLQREHDWIRTTCLMEPRGFDAIVGAAIWESQRVDCVASVVFFNNTGYLNGCIHGTIGVVRTLQHLGRIDVGCHGIETPVGRVTATIGPDGRIKVQNVLSERFLANVEVDVPGHGTIVGHVAWGGNWFFLADAPENIPLRIDHRDALANHCRSIRRALENNQIMGREGGQIDHIELFGPPDDPSLADSKNFVLCPGGAFDRSPCGTGTSAKLACLAAEGRLLPGQRYRQNSILNTTFTGHYENHASGGVLPTIEGTAHVTCDARLLVQDCDPFGHGISLAASRT